MKKITQFAAVLTVLFVLGSCSKGSYNKWLTSGTWNLSSYTTDDKTVTTRTYVASSANNYTNTHDQSASLSGGTATSTDYQEYKPGTGTTTYTKNVTTQTESGSITFDKSGTYTFNHTKQVTGSSYSDDHTPVTTTVLNTTPSTSVDKNDWSWQEDGSIKDQMLLAGIGLVQVKLTKSSLTWTYNSSSTDNTSGTDGLGDWSQVQTQTTSWNYSFSK